MSVLTFVEVADGRAGALDDVAERGSFEPTLGERLCGGLLERVSDFGLWTLGHKENF